jgi:hypothetical protein
MQRNTEGNAMFIVTVETPAGTSYLRKTVWTFAGNRDRAEEYASREAAQAALDKAKPFMAARIYRAARIVEA